MPIFLCEFVSYVLHLQCMLVGNIKQSMNFKRSYYGNGGLRVKKRKLGSVEHVDVVDDIPAGTTAFLKFCTV